MNINSKYYMENKDSFIKNTIDCDMSVQYEFFLKYLPSTGTILDLGFGSGRDMLYFHNLGYLVVGIDPTIDFVSMMKEQNFEVYEKTCEEMDFKNRFDGIWACASMLHIPSKDLNLAFKKCDEALKEKGILYTSFKYGTFEGERNGRLFTDLNESSIKDYLYGTRLQIKEIIVTNDVRQNRCDEKWLNCILEKV